MEKLNENDFQKNFIKTFTKENSNIVQKLIQYVLQAESVRKQLSK